MADRFTTVDEYVASLLGERPGGGGRAWAERRCAGPSEA